jgi:anti-sigma regulatory factor (Ser/Thr protein kinase)
VTTVINTPPSLEEKPFEQVFDQVALLPPDEKIIVDTRHVRWANPYGLTALLALAQSRSERPVLYAPEAENVSSYWSRMSFFKHAAELYDIQGKVYPPRGVEPTNVLLEVTSISQTDDVHTAVDRISQRAQETLVQELKLDPRITGRFAMALSEVCQNIVEHAGRGGWVAVQRYQWRVRLGGRKVVVIAVCDSGVGFRGSLESSPAFQPDDRWDDRLALEETLMRGVSRYPDRHRGHGLQGVKNFVASWDGKLSIRSGTARIMIPPKGDWDVEDEQQMQQGLAYFPGAQVQITIPERVI